MIIYTNIPASMFRMDLTLCKSCADVFFNSKRDYIVLAMTDLEERNYCYICRKCKGRDLLLYERREKEGQKMNKPIEEATFTS